MRQDARLLTPLLALLAALAPAALGPAAAEAAPEKVSVLILGSTEGDGELADNVTEVVIAAIAARGGFEITGKEEFRGRLGIGNDRRAQACLDDIACLGRTAVSLGVRRIVAGSVGMRGRQFLFNLNLNDVEKGKVDHRVFRLVEGTVEDLVRAVEAGTAELFRPKVEPGRVQITTAPAGARVSVDNAYLGVTPLISGTLLPGAHRVRVEADGRFPWISTVEVLPGQDLGINLTEKNLPARRRWPAWGAYGAGALALGAVATGGFLGVLSQLNVSGSTMAAAQEDFRQKQDLARAANVSFATGGALALSSAVLFLVFRDDVFGRN